MNQWKLEVITGSWRKARENACERVTIGFGCTSDWMKKWRESFKPIVWRRKYKTNYFSTLKWKPLYTLTESREFLWSPGIFERVIIFLCAKGTCTCSNNDILTCRQSWKLTNVAYKYTLFIFVRILLFPVKAEYSYFPAEFRLKISLAHIYIKKQFIIFQFLIFALLRAKIEFWPNCSCRAWSER